MRVLASILMILAGVTSQGCFQLKKGSPSQGGDSSAQADSAAQGDSAAPGDSPGSSSGGGSGQVGGASPGQQVSSLAMILSDNRVKAGDPVTVTVKALAADGALVSDFSGPVDLKSDDPAFAGVSAVFDSGVASISAILTSAGDFNLVATGSDLSAMAVVHVDPGAFSPSKSGIVFNGVLPLMKRQTVTANLILRDEFGNAGASDVKDVSLIGLKPLTDPSAVKFGTIVDLGAGVYSFDFTPLSSGALVIAASVTGMGLDSTLNLDVSDQLVPFSAGIMAANSPGVFSVIRVRAIDRHGNLDPDYFAKSTVVYSSTDSGIRVGPLLPVSPGLVDFQVAFSRPGEQILGFKDPVYGNLSLVLTIPDSAVSTSPELSSPAVSNDSTVLDPLLIAL